MGGCHYNHRAFDLALTCLEGAVKIRKYRVSQLTTSDELVELYAEEVSLGAEFFNLGNVHMQMGDYAQAMHCFIQSRDLRWRHVGSGTVEKILEKYYSESTIDEDELLGLGKFDLGNMCSFLRNYNRELTSMWCFFYVTQPTAFTILESCSTSKRSATDLYPTTKKLLP